MKKIMIQPGKHNSHETDCYKRTPLGEYFEFWNKKKHEQKSDNKNKQDNVTELCLLGENKIRFNKSI